MMLKGPLQNTIEPRPEKSLKSRSRRLIREAEEREYRVMYALALWVCLWLVLFARVLPRSLRPEMLSSPRPQSIWADAKAAASLTVSFAFMRA
ncbi:MAG: hypothetical protein AAF619_10815 [Pseudomonadota bacterium]